MVLLHEEISKLLCKWKNNEWATCAQKKAFGQYKELTLQMLGNCQLSDKEDCLRLSIKDDWDGDYVGSVSPEMAERYGNPHFPVWPYDRDIFRISLFFHLDIYRALVLMMKSRWEQFIYRLKIEGRINDGKELFETLKADDDLNQYQTEFIQIVEYESDFRAIFSLAESYQRSASWAHHNRTSLTNMLYAMIIAKVHLCAIDSDEVQCFIKQQEKETADASSNGFDVAKEYHRVKEQWVKLSVMIEKLLVDIATLREKNAFVKAKWASEFAGKWVRLLEMESEYRSLSLFINVKEMNPKMSFESVKEIAVVENEKQRKALEEETKQLRWFEGLNKMITRGVSIGSDVNKADTTAYIAENQKLRAKLLRNIYMLTHPDRTVNENFTVHQAEELLMLYQCVTQQTETDGREMTVGMLENVLERAEKVWDKMGVDFVYTQMFPDTNEPEKMIDEARQRIIDLEEKEADIRNEMFVLLHDEEVRKKGEDIQSSTSIQNRHIKLDQSKEIIQKKIESLRAKIDLLFGKGGWIWS